MIITSLEQLDFDKKYSYADYLTWQFDEFVELIKGKIMPMSAPSSLHQKASMRLSKVFINYIDDNYLDCMVYAAPFDVRLLRNPNESLENRISKTDKEIYTVVQPDICVICDLEKVDDKGCKGSPNLIIEIVSEKIVANARRDVEDKYEIYETNGVSEYWLARPIEQTIQKYILNTSSNKYESKGFYRTHETITCSIFPELEIKVSDIFR